MNHYIIEELGEFIRKDNAFILSLIKKSGYGLFYATKEQRADRELAFKAISLNTWAFDDINESLRKDKKFVLEVIKLTKDKKSYDLVSSIDKNLTKNRAFIIE